MTFKTQGTEIYFIDPATDEVVQIECPTGITGAGATRDQIDVTCLESDSKMFEPGQKTPNTINVPINLNSGHHRLWELYNDGERNLHFAIGFSDGTDDPTVDTDGAFDLPTTRSWLVFDGYVADFPFEIALAAVVTSNVTIQPSGDVMWIPKA